MTTGKQQSQIVVRPIGVVTQPNKLGVFPPGALATADGATMRAPGQIDVHGLWSSPYGQGRWTPAFFTSTQILMVRTAPSSQYAMMVAFTDGTDWHYGWGEIGDYQSLSTSFMQYVPNPALGLGGANSEILSHYSTTSSTNRTFFAFRDSVGVFENNPNITSPSFPRPRVAGLQPPNWSFSQLISGGALPTNTYCHTIAVHRRVLWDGTELISAPSYAQQCLDDFGFGAPRNLQYQILSSFDLLAGDFIDFYRTRAQPISTSSGTNTGADYYLSSSYTVPAGFTNAAFIDSTNDQSLGEALYTNSGVRGEGAANYAPPPCRAVCDYKGYTFFLGVTDLPSITLRVGVAWGYLGDAATGASAYARQNGIGSRKVNGNVSNGSNTMTGVSAADLVGIKVGQEWFGGGFGFSGGSPSVFVTAVGASSITFSSTATSTATGTYIYISDVIEVDGVAFLAPSFSYFAYQLNSVMQTNPTALAVCQDLVLPLAGLFGASQNPVTQPADSFTIFRPVGCNNSNFGAMRVRATNGFNFTPRLPRIELAETAQSVPVVPKPNFVQWSELNQPEAAPDANRFPIGNGTLLCGVSTRDAMFIFATDGLRRLSGTGGRAGDGFDWRVDPVDPTLILAGDQCAVVLQDIVYAYTTRGLVSIDSSGNVTDLSRGRVGDRFTIPPATAYTPSSLANWMVADITNNEIVFYDSTNSPSNPWIYNQLTDAFTRYNLSKSSGTIGTPAHAVWVSDGRLLVGDLSVGTFVIATLASSASAQVLYQPFYSGNPFMKRRWQRVHYVFDNPSFPDGTGANLNINAMINGINSYPPTGSLLASKQDLGQDFARVSWLIPRNAPAVSNHIQLGWRQLANAARGRFFGLSVDSIDISDQRVKRG